MTHFKKFKEELPNKGKFYSLLIDKKYDKGDDHVLKVWNKFETKAMK